MDGFRVLAVAVLGQLYSLLFILPFQSLQTLRHYLLDYRVISVERIIC